MTREDLRALFDARGFVKQEVDEAEIERREAEEKELRRKQREENRRIREERRRERERREQQEAQSPTEAEAAQRFINIFFCAHCCIYFVYFALHRVVCNYIYIVSKKMLKRVNYNYHCMDQEEKKMSKCVLLKKRERKNDFGV